MHEHLEQRRAGSLVAGAEFGGRPQVLLGRGQRARRGRPLGYGNQQGGSVLAVSGRGAQPGLKRQQFTRVAAAGACHRVGGAELQRGPVRRIQIGRDDLGGQGVAEHRPAGLVVRDQELSVDGFADSGADAGLGQRGDRAEQPPVEARAEHRSCPDHPLRHGSERIQPLEHDVAEPLRYGGGHDVGRPGQQRGEQVLDQQRQASGAGHDRGRLVRRQLTADGSQAPGSHLSGLAIGQRRQDGAGHRTTGRQLTAEPAGRGGRGPGGQQQPDRIPGQVVGHVLDHPQGLTVGPVQVLKHHQQPARLRGHARDRKNSLSERHRGHVGRPASLGQPGASLPSTGR